MSCEECKHWIPIRRSKMKGAEPLYGNCIAPLPDCFLLEEGICLTLALQIRDIDTLRRKMFCADGVGCPCFDGKDH